MSDAVTKRMLEAYYQEGQPSFFLSSLFRAPPQNYYESEAIEVDVERCDPDVAIALHDVADGYRYNTTDLYTNKEFKPPVFKEALALSSYDLMKRQPGQDPFADVSYQANLTLKAFNGIRKIEAKIRRVMELQASQVLQTGIISLYNGAQEVYQLDYKPKASHFPTSATAWDQASPAIVQDLTGLAEEIRKDSLMQPDQLFFGTLAFEAFISDEEVQKRFVMRHADLGQISSVPVDNPGGASYRGRVALGSDMFDVYTYGAVYKDSQSGATVPYLDPTKVVMRASAGRLDATFGAVPNIGEMLGQGSTKLLPALPARMSNGDGRMDIYPSAWLSEDGSQMFCGAASRVLMIPTAIDSYGCLDTGIS